MTAPAMKITFIVTIDPVKDPFLLNILVHSLNLQTVRAFDVVFYNQTLLDEGALLSRLVVRPTFDYSFRHVDRRLFFGRYPLWDLYELHDALLAEGGLNEYLMSLHMEEFLDVDYVEHVLPVLAAQRLDILFGNLTRTSLTSAALRPLLTAATPKEFDDALRSTGASQACHWAFDRRSLFAAHTLEEFRHRLAHRLRFRRDGRLRPTPAGCTALRTYLDEDVYFMRREFAERYNWFLRGHHLYFEDIHICQQEGVSELGPELQRLTGFPVYFNLRSVYHVPHPRYYYQLADEEFTTRLLDYPSTDPVLTAHKTAIRLNRAGRFTLDEAVRYTRKNSEGTGTQNLNYQYHMRYLQCSR